MLDFCLGVGRAGTIECRRDEALRWVVVRIPLSSHPDNLN